MLGTKGCIEHMHELLELMGHCFDYDLFICCSTNNVDVVGFDSCKEAAWLWEHKVSCNLLKGCGLFRDR